jgi:hypothetical protein
MIIASHIYESFTLYFHNVHVYLPFIPSLVLSSASFASLRTTMLMQKLTSSVTIKAVFYSTYEDKLHTVMHVHFIRHEWLFFAFDF